MGYGGVAQLGERLLCKQEVIGSIPFTSTIAFALGGIRVQLVALWMACVGLGRGAMRAIRVLRVGFYLTAVFCSLTIWKKHNKVYLTISRLSDESEYGL
jgi:hypothetical protein